MPDEYIAFMRPDGKSANDHSFENAMRIPLQ